jgi:hypothetical protein
MIRYREILAGLALVCAPHVTAATAQPLGTFRWQTQPFCNVVSLTIVQQGAIYQLNGVDDLCGAGPAPVNGTATLTASGVVLGFTVSTPSGRPVHVSAQVSLSTSSGTWTDGEGNAGAFVFNPASATGAPRPSLSSQVLSATVSSGGALLRGVGAVSASRSGFVYQVDFSREVATCTVGVSVVETQSNSFNVMFAAANVLASNPRAVRVLGFNANGGSTLLPLTLLVACP